MNGPENFALVPKAPGALEKAEPSARRIISGMVADTLVLAKREAHAKRVFRVLTCSGEEILVEAWQKMIQHHLGTGYLVEVTDRWRATEIIELLERQPFDLIVPLVNNILVPTHVGEDRIVKAVELLARVKARYATPIIAFSGGDLDSDLPRLLRRGGIEAFFGMPYSHQEFLDALRAVLRIPPDAVDRAGEIGMRPPKIVVVDDEETALILYATIVRRCFKNVILRTFQNRDEAWQELLRADPDLLITDMNNDNVPGRTQIFGMSGWKMLLLLAERRVKYPILVISGSFSMEGIESKARQFAGPDLNVSFLTKPFASEVLTHELIKHLGPGGPK